MSKRFTVDRVEVDEECKILTAYQPGGKTFCLSFDDLRAMVEYIRTDLFKYTEFVIRGMEE